MGEAKRRGTYEQRKQLAIAREAKMLAVRREIYGRRPSPKHTALMASILATALATASEAKP